MYPRIAIALLFSFVAFGLSTAFVVPDCGPNAEFLRCGSACAPTCAEPEPKTCTLQCVMGCFCKSGFLRNEKGECVRKEQCETQQPQNYVMPQCPDNEQFHMCGSACAPTCANPHPSPICTRQCIIGCFCKPGFLRNKMHACVPTEKCEAPTPAPVNNLFAYPPGYTPMPVEPQVCVGVNEEFRQCKGCDGTCDNPHPICPKICRPGCACKQGHVRDTTGKCIKFETCQKMGLNMMMMPPPVCKDNEVFKTCGTACPATCDNPHPSAICTKNCVIGCFCQEGFLRNANGMCVAAANCELPVESAVTRPYGDDILCPTDREVYLDSDKASELDCMQNCDTPLPWMKQGKVVIPPKCKAVKPAPGCVCRFPYVRNEQGKCVERQECHKTMTTTPAH